MYPLDGSRELPAAYRHYDIIRRLQSYLRDGSGGLLLFLLIIIGPEYVERFKTKFWFSREVDVDMTHVLSGSFLFNKVIH